MKPKKKTEIVTINPRQIAQAHYIMSVTANRLLKMAMHKFNANQPKAEVKFSFSEYFEKYHIEHPGAEDKRLLKMACKELRQAGLEVEEEYQGGFAYVGINIVSKVSAFLTSWGLDELTVKFTDEMATLIAEYEKLGYSRLNIEEFGKLDGKYEQRFFELAMSYKGFEGKDGNAPETWWFEYSIAELREVLKTEKLYPRIGNFRDWVIERSIAKINEANIGLEISMQKGKKRLSERDKIRFHCKIAPINPARETKTNKNEAKTAEGADSKEIFQREAYPNEWQKFFDEEKDKRLALNRKFNKGNALTPEAENIIAEQADERLKEYIDKKKDTGEVLSGRNGKTRKPRGSHGQDL